PTNDPLSGWNDPQPWYTSATGRTEPSPRRTVAATLGKIAAAVGWVALAWALVVVVTACSVTVEPAGSHTDEPTPSQTATGYSAATKEPLLRDAARGSDDACYLFRELGAESVARNLNKADTDVKFNKYMVQRVLIEECAS